MTVPWTRTARFKSSWVFPAPFDEDFLEYWNSTLPIPSINSTVQQNMSATTYDLLTFVAQNAPALNRWADVAPWNVYAIGNSYASPAVGDFIMPERHEGVIGNLDLYCVVCSSGLVTTGMWGACDGYNDTSHVSQFFNTTYFDHEYPNSDPLLLKIPPLSSTLDLPIHSIALCLFQIYEDDFIDYTTPFPIKQQPGRVPYRYSSEYPAGQPDTTSTETATSHSKPYDDGEMTTGELAGTIVGAIVGIAILIGFGFILFRRRIARVEQSGNDAESRAPVLIVEEVEEAGPPPPPYHEAIRAKP